MQLRNYNLCPVSIARPRAAVPHARRSAKNMSTKDSLHHYVTLSEPDGPITLMGAEGVDDAVKRGLVGEDFTKLWDIYAASSEEASSIHHLRLGHGPYNPIGEPAKCPRGCGAFYYPKGSGQCALCGFIQ